MLFEEKYNLLIENFASKISNKDDVSKFRNYMQELYLIREQWAYYYTHQIFSAASQSTQRNESINGVIKRHIISCTRTKFLRLTEIFHIIITKTEEKV